MSALVVPSQHEQRFRIADLQCPQVQYTLHVGRANGWWKLWVREMQREGGKEEKGGRAKGMERVLLYTHIQQNKGGCEGDILTLPKTPTMQLFVQMYKHQLSRRIPQWGSVCTNHKSCTGTHILWYYCTCTLHCTCICTILGRQKTCIPTRIYNAL